MGVWPCGWWRHRWMSDWGEGIRGFGALLRADRGISQDFEGKTKKRLFCASQCYWVTVAHPTLKLSRVKISPQSSLIICSSRFWMTETPGQLTPIQMLWAWRASTLGDRIPFRAETLDRRTIWDADHPQQRVTPSKVLSLSQSIEIAHKARSSGKAFLGLLCWLQEGAKPRNRLPCSLPKVGELIPYTGWGGGCVQGSCWRGGLGGLPTPMWCLVQGDFCSRTPRFLLPALRKWQYMFFLSLYLLVQNLPQLRMHRVIFSPI